MLDKDDPQIDKPEMKCAVYNELQYKLCRGTFRVLFYEEMPYSAVFGIKSGANGNMDCKARFVVRDHRNRPEDYLVRSAHTLQASSA